MSALPGLPVTDDSDREQLGRAISVDEVRVGRRYADEWDGDQRIEWLYLHLDIARRRRAEAERLDTASAQFADLSRDRFLALAQAMKHLAALRRMGRELPPDIAEMLAAHDNR